MKKWFLMVLAGLCVWSAGAAPVAKRVKISDFTGIVAGSVFKITLVRSSSCSAEIICDPELEPAIRVSVRDGKLFLEYDPPRDASAKYYNNVQISAVVAMPTLTYLDLSGAARLTASDRFDAGASFEERLSGAASATGLNIGADYGYLELSGAASAQGEFHFKKAFYSLSGAAKLSGSDEADEVRLDAGGAVNVTLSTLHPGAVTLNATGAPSVTVEGRTETLRIVCSGAGHVNAGGLNARSAEVNCSGASSVDVTATDELHADVTGCSRVTYGGNPRKFTGGSVGKMCTLKQR